MSIRELQPLWSHPTCVLFVDDNSDFLLGLTKQIDDAFSFDAYTRPREALEYLKGRTLPLDYLARHVVSDAESTDGKQALLDETVAINFSPLSNALDKKNRFEFCAVAIVDKLMEEMDGLDFCRAVRRAQLPVKLIMLTGNAGNDQAVSAFNDGIIDAFVRKADADRMDQINHHIQALSLQAFRDASIQLMGPLINKFPLLKDQNFVSFFEKIKKKEGIVEYYIIDSSGSYLLINAEGEAKILLVKRDEDFMNAYDLAKDASNTEVHEALKMKQAFPATGMQSYLISDPTEWSGRMMPMKYNEEQGFYYTVVPYNLEVLSFDRYRQEIWKPEIL